MKIQLRLILFCILLLISKVNTLGNAVQEEIHDNAQFPKAYTLDDQNVLVLISVPGEQKSYEAKLDKTGETIYSYIPSNIGYSPSADFVVPHSKDGNISDPLIFHHNKQNSNGAVHSDYITKFSQGKVLISKKDPQNKFYERKSLIALKNGKVFLAGINDASEPTIDVKIYDPKTNTFGSGISFEGIGKFVSCYELKENQVYCAYVIKQYPFVSKLKLKHLEINPTSNSIVPKGEQVIKTFYTVFNYLKAIAFNEEESIIVFRVGNGELNPKNGNSGKELFYYQLQLSEEEALVSAVRYDKLDTYCTFRDDEDDSIDVAVLSDKRIYIACEADEGKLRGYIIYPGKTNIDGFYFNKFDAKEIRNPVFAKFGKSLGIFYTYITEANNYKVNFHIMNYPECDDYYQNKIYLLPKHNAKDNFDFHGKVFMSNPYPASRMKEKIKVKFNNYEDIKDSIKIVDTENENKEIEPGKEYDPENLYLKFISNGIEGIYSIEYIATRMDDLDGLIEGKICRIKLNIPKCLEQCYSCIDLGTEEKNACLGCKNESYYITEYDGTVNDGYGKPHNCSRCNESCYTCDNKFTLEPFPTTNCIKCDYKNGYYHLYNNTKTCISEKTQGYWEEVYDHALYLDKTPENDETQWRWRYCHDNCGKCSGPGDDIDNNCDECKDGFYFFCNQTKGNGIPGSCHDNCKDNGFYIKESEGYEKCCPCINECKVCKDDFTCNECYKPFYLSHDNDSCVEDCGYCYAKDNTTFDVWRCTNCKEDYDVEKYNLNGTCYDSIPKITYKDEELFGKYHHILDDKCNWLIGCKGGCFNCTPWYTEQCTTKCKPAYYKKDFYRSEQPITFPCYTERECQGLDRYKYDTSEDIGGVPKNITDEGLCYNCWLRDNLYRQVENNFTCGPRKKGTYISIPYYGKLSKCYFRCATCDEYGNSCRHNCLSCRDPSLYFLVKYDENKPEGDCKRGHPKCGILPYYHDYNIAEELGLEVDCGTDCDVCLTNGTCTENYPFYVPETRECVEICGFDEIMSKTCTMNETDSINKLMDDIKEQQNYQNLNSSANIATYIKKIILEKYSSYFNIDITKLEQNINNYVGSGQIFNIPNSQIIIGNNISVELTTNKLESEKLNSIINELLGSSIIKNLNEDDKEQTEKTETITIPTTNPEPQPTTPSTTETKSSTTTTITQATTTTTNAPSKENEKKEEDKKEETKKEEDKKEDETKKEEDKKEDETKKEETKKEDETKKEETKKEETKKEETKKEETKKEEEKSDNINSIIPNFNMSETSILDISDCENALKKAYNLPNEEDILIIKGNSIKELTDYYYKHVDFLLFSLSIGKILDISYCKEKTIKISSPFNAGNLKTSPVYQYKINSVAANGYNAFDPKSDFYYDLCTSFTNENGNDVTLDDRRRDYFMETINLCGADCTFIGYNESSNMYSCECIIEKSGGEEKEIISKTLPQDFYQNHTFSNLKVVMCYPQVFSLEGQLTKNIGSYALAVCFLCFVVVGIIYFVKGPKQIDQIFAGFTNNDIKEKANPPKVEDKSNPDSNVKSVNTQENEKDIISEEDLNTADYEDAKEDNRSFIKLYWSLIKMKQLFIFTFYTYTDHNLRIIKIGLFILFVSFYIAFTALFFNDDIVKKMYQDKGKTDIIIHIPNIIYSSLACIIMSLLIKFISLSGKDIIKAKKDKKSADKIKKCIKIKTGIVFGISALLIILFWYYVSAFCCVFKNSQVQYFLNVAGAFILCNIWPFVTSLLSPPLRIYGIKHKSPCAYKASQIIAYI